jgi:KaiC/GvpD/RAD55 family RecA-like ATPase
MLGGIATGIHSQPLYKRVENAVDGIIEVAVMERHGEVQDLLRVKSLKGQPRDSRWHRIDIKPNGEARLVS